MNLETILVAGILVLEAWALYDQLRTGRLQRAYLSEQFSLIALEKAALAERQKWYAARTRQSRDVAENTNAPEGA